MTPPAPTTPPGVYCRRDTVVRAIRFTGENADEVRSFHGTDIPLGELEHHGPTLFLDTTHGPRAVIPGDWVVAGVSGDLDHCAHRDFTTDYRLLEEQPA